MRRKRFRQRAEGEQDFELNLASIIDCFTVLITYLLISTSFISIGMMDVSVASMAGQEAPSEVPKLILTITLNQKNQFVLKTEGQENRTLVVEAKDNQRDYEGMAGQLKAVHEKHPDLTSVMVSAENAVAYREVVKAVETAKAESFQVALSSDLGSQQLE